MTYLERAEAFTDSVSRYPLSDFLQDLDRSSFCDFRTWLHDARNIHTINDLLEHHPIVQDSLYRQFLIWRDDPDAWHGYFLQKSELWCDASYGEWADLYESSEVSHD